MKPVVSVFWFRRDLRLEDNTGLYYCLQQSNNVLPIFIFDDTILEDIRENNTLILDKRMVFIHRQVEQLKRQLKKYQSDLLVLQGNPITIWQNLITNYKIQQVNINHDYEPYAIQRDKQIANLLQENNISVYSFKDQVIFEKNEILTSNNEPYVVFTPYSKKWKAQLKTQSLYDYNIEKYTTNFYKFSATSNLITLESIGFRNDTTVVFPKSNTTTNLIKNYEQTRDIPSINGTSRLGIHLRFGTISIRKLVQQTIDIGAEKFLNELIWREFYMQILYHFPYVVHQSFKKEYDKLPWHNNETHFELWCKGNTGYPLVDAGMRELNQTGYMHNRVRMLVSSFLCKHLLIDWRWGEAYFAKYLLDYELSSNNGGWQWSAGCGVDAAPYFRIFNPIVQAQKFDPNLDYIKRWIPEYDTSSYSQPIIEHDFARKRCLNFYKLYL